MIPLVEDHVDSRIPLQAGEQVILGGLRPVVTGLGGDAPHANVPGKTVVGRHLPEIDARHGKTGTEGVVVPRQLLTGVGPGATDPVTAFGQRRVQPLVAVVGVEQQQIGMHGYVGGWVVEIGVGEAAEKVIGELEGDDFGNAVQTTEELLRHVPHADAVAVSPFLSRAQVTLAVHGTVGDGEAEAAVIGVGAEVIDRQACQFFGQAGRTEAGVPVPAAWIEIAPAIDDGEELRVRGGVGRWRQQ